ncbi:MAG: SGNH/GDSL hydrolase family protein [Solobacterium sp.]|nr:SGNH/GDSL hydrolase family protein [Solobacterium sp.]
MTKEEWMEMIAGLSGNDEQYDVSRTALDRESKLKGKTIIFLGSSVTFGAASLEQSFVEYLEAKEGIIPVKEAVSGTTLVTSEENNYIERMEKLSKDIRADAFICQLSTNDATRNKPLGIISKDGNFDTETIIGAIEYIISYAKETWHCPVYFYTGTKYDSALYAKMVEALYDIQKKWNIGIIDLWNNEEMCSVSKEDYALWMADPIHPSKAGYRDWWTPVFVSFLKENL